MTIKHLLVCGWLALMPFAAHAQNTTAAVIPTPLHGQGVFTASTSSVGLAKTNITLAPNSAPWPTDALPATLELKVQGTATVGISVCWLGGTCTAAVGEYIAPGESQTRIMPTQSMTAHPPTVISTGTPVVTVEW